MPSNERHTWECERGGKPPLLDSKNCAVLFGCQELLIGGNAELVYEHLKGEAVHISAIEYVIQLVRHHGLEAAGYKKTGAESPCLFVCVELKLHQQKQNMYLQP